MRVETYLLEYFVAIVEAGSVLSAAEKLHISQPSLSRSLQKLENELEFPLFDRSGNRLYLNEAGRHIYNEAKDILRMHDHLLDTARNIKEKRMNLKLSSVAPGPFIKFARVGLFDTKGFSYTTSLESEDTVIQGLRDGVYDVGFLAHPLDDENYISKLYLEEHLYIALPKTHFLCELKGPLYLKDADGQSFVVDSKLGIWDQLLDEHLPHSKILRVESSGLGEVVSNSTIPSFVTNVSFYDRNELDRVFIPFADEAATKRFYAVYRKRNKDIIERILFPNY